MFGVKKKPWWPFIPITHYVIPLLHCMIGVGNQLLDMLRDIINENLENMTHTEERALASIPLLRDIIDETIANRDAWDASNEGKLRKTLKRKVEAAKDSRDAQNDNEIVAGNASSLEQAQQNTHPDEIKWKELDEYRN